MTRARIVIFALLAAGCGDDSPPANMRVATTPAATEAATAVASPSSVASTVQLSPWDAQPCGEEQPQIKAMVGHEALRARSPDELRTAYGTPSSSEEYRLGDVEGLFRSSTINILPGGPARNADRKALEMVWTKQGCDLFVRFVQQGGRWQAVEAFETPVGTDF